MMVSQAMRLDCMPIWRSDYSLTVAGCISHSPLFSDDSKDMATLMKAQAIDK